MNAIKKLNSLPIYSRESDFSFLPINKQMSLPNLRKFKLTPGIDKDIRKPRRSLNKISKGGKSRRNNKSSKRRTYRKN